MRAVTTVNPSVALSDRSGNRFSRTHAQRVRHLQSTGVSTLSHVTLRVCVLPCRPPNTLQRLPRAYFSTRRVAIRFCVYGATTFSLQHRPSSFQWKKAGRAATSQACTSVPSSSLRVCALYTAVVHLGTAHGRPLPGRVLSPAARRIESTVAQRPVLHSLFPST